MITALSTRFDKFNDKMERKIAKEFKIVTNTLLSENNSLEEGGNGNGKDFKKSLIDLLDRKVDIYQFNEEIQNKINKKEYHLVINQLDLFHK